MALRNLGLSKTTYPEEKMYAKVNNVDALVCATALSTSGGCYQPVVQVWIREIKTDVIHKDSS
jgi:hypothetical protein